MNAMPLVILTSSGSTELKAGEINELAVVNRQT